MGCSNCKKRRPHVKGLGPREGSPDGDGWPWEIFWRTSNRAHLAPVTRFGRNRVYVGQYVITAIFMSWVYFQNDKSIRTKVIRVSHHIGLRGYFQFRNYFSSWNLRPESFSSSSPAPGLTKVSLWYYIGRKLFRFSERF